MKKRRTNKVNRTKKFIKRLELEILLKRTENELNLGVLTDTMTDEKADSLFNVQDSLGVELDKLKKPKRKKKKAMDAMKNREMLQGWLTKLLNLEETRMERLNFELRRLLLLLPQYHTTYINLVRTQPLLFQLTHTYF